MEIRANFFSALALFTIAAVMIAALWIGCSAPLTRLKTSYAVEEHFERSKLYPGLQYYAIGNMNEPLALVALRTDVELATKAWTAVEMTPRRLSTWIDAFAIQPWIEYNQLPNGAVITNAQGNPVGYFYSVWKYPQVRFIAHNRIEIDPPVAELRPTNRVWKDD
jgi:hypothetical protein